MAMVTPNKIFAKLVTLTSNFRFYIAYSGGLDSHVLLHVMSECLKKNPFLRIQALHINHGLSSKSELWEQHCRRVCEQLRIPVQVERLKLEIFPGRSIEKIAREARYAIFRRVIRKDENILTAHTQNDQAETFLLQLMRGAGIKGLSSMPIKKKLGSGYLLRLLLNFCRNELQDYAEKNFLHWIEDDTNLELRFNRNYLRHRIFPILQKRWSKAFPIISRSASHCAEAAILLDQLADSDLQTLQTGMKLAIKPLLQLTSSRQRNVLRRWIAHRGFLVPQTKQLEQIQKDVLRATRDANPIFTYGNVEIRRYNDELYLSDVLRYWNVVNLVIPWSFCELLTLPANLGILKAVKRKGIGIAAAIRTCRVTIRFRKGGEQCCPVGRKKSFLLKELMREWKIPVWQRNSIPLVYYEEKLASVVGYCVCEEFSVKPSEWGWVVCREMQ